MFSFEGVWSCVGKNKDAGWVLPWNYPKEQKKEKKNKKNKNEKKINF